MKKSRKKYFRRYRKNNPEKIKKWRMDYYKKNRKKVLKLMKKWRDGHKRIYKKLQKKSYIKHKKKRNLGWRIYYRKNRKWMIKRVKEYYRKHKKEMDNKDRIRRNRKYKNDIQWKLRHNLRTRLLSLIRNKVKIGSAVKDLGCSISFLKAYITKKFYDNMTWKNYGKLWVIDHIIPLFKFDLTDRKQFLKACNYKNLQPLTKSDHYKKNTKEIYEKNH